MTLSPSRRTRGTWIRLLLVALAMACPVPPAAQERGTSNGRPLAPSYRIHADGSVTQRLCFNWSCSSRQRLRFSAEEMAEVARQMDQCSGPALHERVQRIRIGIWQMELLAERHQPLLANDEAINDLDWTRDGRMDCIDNTTNTATYLKILLELGLLPGWSLGPARVRDRFSMQVHWTAVVVDLHDDRSWAVDSWFRANGHLPFVMPLGNWLRGDAGWHAPLSDLNPHPRHSSQLCPT